MQRKPYRRDPAPTRPSADATRRRAVEPSPFHLAGSSRPTHDGSPPAARIVRPPVCDSDRSIGWIFAANCQQVMGVQPVPVQPHHSSVHVHIVEPLGHVHRVDKDEPRRFPGWCRLLSFGSSLRSVMPRTDTDKVSCKVFHCAFQRGVGLISLTSSTPPGASSAAAAISRSCCAGSGQQVEHVDDDDRVPWPGGDSAGGRDLEKEVLPIQIAARPVAPVRSSPRRCPLRPPTREGSARASVSTEQPVSAADLQDPAGVRQLRLDARERRTPPPDGGMQPRGQRQLPVGVQGGPAGPDRPPRVA